MNQLTELGVPDEIQNFFNCNELRFYYGDDIEEFSNDFHLIPATRNLWMAGEGVGRDVIITSSAIEAISFLTCNKHRFPDFKSLTLVAVGNLPHTEQGIYIKKLYPKRQFTLAFGNDLYGRLADIKIAAGLANKPVRLLYSDAVIRVTFEGLTYEFEYARLSLNAFKKAFGLRTGISTVKPKIHNTFLDQLKNHGKL